MRRRFDQLPIWQGALVIAASCFLGVAAAAVTVLLTGHHVDIPLLAKGGTFLAVVAVSSSALTRRLRTRRSEKRGADRQS